MVELLIADCWFCKSRFAEDLRELGRIAHDRWYVVRFCFIFNLFLKHNFAGLSRMPLYNLILQLCSKKGKQIYYLLSFQE